MQENQKRLSVSFLIVQALVAGLTIAALYYLNSNFDLPLGMTASFALFVVFLALTLYYFKQLDRARKVFLGGLSISFLILTILFTASYLNKAPRPSVLHIILLIMPPALIFQCLNKGKNRDNTGQTHPKI